jgi:hypothetical protein
MAGSTAPYFDIPELDAVRAGGATDEQAQTLGWRDAAEAREAFLRTALLELIPIAALGAAAVHTRALDTDGEPGRVLGRQWRAHWDSVNRARVLVGLKEDRS